MRIDSDHAWIEVVRRVDDDDAFAVACSVGEFAARNPTICIEGSVQRRFVNDLRRLELERRGEATIGSTSPEDFELAVRIVDRFGHASIQGVIGLREFSADTHRYEQRLLRFEFSIDPTSLPDTPREFEQLFGTV